ncbi:protein unc-93 homolog A-like [Branchiostoma floridae]|uniref:Protein unc-93 homolog A n=1 Tax=Branchiostoma floridae TaxID=7739 RepID=A0A9J7MC77_BRAFL|nr:protein unc-93 homolog A-like [Branchiostoma floridae]XP_035698229.1 protein unc-93 homolog A-like [Branchiostoma floridae]
MEKTTPRTKLLKEGSAHQLSFTKRIWKNILVLSSAFLLNFTAFRGLQSLQSTLNSEAGLGVVSLSCVYASMVLSCMYAPFFIHKVGSCKWTIVVCFFGHVLYTGSNFYPSWYTLMPSSVLLGAISGPLWTAQITYLTSSAQEYAELLQHDSLEGDIAKFNGVFYLLNDLSGIIGNLISSLLFSAGTQDIGKGEFCGAMDCGIRPEANYTSHYVTNSSAPYKLAGFPADDKEHVIARYILFGVFLVCNLLAALVAGLCLDKNANSKELSSAGRIQVSQQVLRTVHVFKDINYVLLVPLLVIIGMAGALVSGDITKSYVSCALGVHMVGYVMICCSLSSTVFSPLIGHLTAYAGARSLILAAVVANAVLLIYMLLWQPDEDSLGMILAVSGGWAVVRTVWRIQLFAVLGTMFPSNQEAVFANAKMAGSIGSMLVFAYSAALCMDVKLYIYMAVLALGTVGFGVFECKTRNKKNQKADTS